MSGLKGVKFVTIFILELKRKTESDDKSKYSTCYSSLWTETNINESDIDNEFESIYSMIISNIQKLFGNSLGWIIGSVIDHNIKISMYKPW